MKIHKFRAAALILCLAVCAAAFASCDNEKNTDAVTSGTVTADIPPEENAGPVEYTAMTFGIDSNSSFLTGAEYGVYSVNNISGTVDITYAESTNVREHYLSKIKFAKGGMVNPEKCWVRVLYSAFRPSPAGTPSMYIYNDKTGDIACLETDINDTNGEFVLTPPASLTRDSMGRFSATGDYSSPLHCSLAITDTAKDSVYSIKAVYFFYSYEDAGRFVYEPVRTDVTISGVDIENYRIVVDADTSIHAMNAAEKLAGRIAELTGTVLPIVTDETEPSQYEILIGRSNRELSYKEFDRLQSQYFKNSRYMARLEGNTLVINAELPYNLGEATDRVIDRYLSEEKIEKNGSANITENLKLNNFIETVQEYGEWKWASSQKDRSLFIEYSDDFSSDDGYFTEENGEDNFKIENGVLFNTEKTALTYIHVYDNNARIRAKLRFDEADSNGEAGLVLRYTAEDAYIKAGYDFYLGEWFIDYREGADFYRLRSDSEPCEISLAQWYTLDFTVEGPLAGLSVDGTPIICDNVTQRTPGRVGIYADGASVSVDDIELTLLSANGIIMKNVVHTKLPYDRYIEGGTVLPMDDGSLIYQNHNGTAYKSLDNGVTWEECDMWTKTNGYTNILRLNDGSWLKMTSGSRSGGTYVYSQTSNDNGMTWIDGGNVCFTKYKGTTTAGAGNMNDKLFQSATTGRIFYSQNYESQAGPVGGRVVFCEFYYSDDNGMTWTKSETDSWEIEGNEKESYFGECKLLECADGTIRMYNSWNQHGCIVYSESHDNGVTFGPLMKMEEFVTPQSSMQFVRDPYADNDTTYYMVWVYGPLHSRNKGMARSRLCLARSEDGKNWDYLGDIWRWEHNYMAPKTLALISHIVDPFIKVTEDYIICGSGFSEQIAVAAAGDNSYHQAQRQHIYSIRKDTLTVSPLPEVSPSLPR